MPPSFLFFLKNFPFLVISTDNVLLLFGVCIDSTTTLASFMPRYFFSGVIVSDIIFEFDFLHICC